MDIQFTADAYASLENYARNSEDCEFLKDRECVLDIFSIEPPVSLNLVFMKNNIVRVDGASTLCFSEEMDGWYMHTPLQSEEEIVKCLKDAGAIA